MFRAIGAALALPLVVADLTCAPGQKFLQCHKFSCFGCTPGPNSGSPTFNEWCEQNGAASVTSDEGLRPPRAAWTGRLDRIWGSVK